MAEAILHLVNLTDETPHKRLARAVDVPPQHREILDDLVDARLVVINEVNDQQVYAPAHESLFSAWPPLVELIERRRDDLVLRGRLERRAADWREGGGTQSGLLSGLELDQARDWRERNSDLATTDVAAYVDASTARQRRGRMIRAGVAAVVAALAVALVVVLLVNARADRRRAERGPGRRAGGDRPARAGARPGRGRRGAAARARARPGRSELQQLSREPAPRPGPRRLPRTGPGDVLPARRGRWRRRGDDGRPDAGLGHRPGDGPHLPAVRRPGGPAGRPGLRRGRRRRRPERLRPHVRRATTRPRSPCSAPTTSRCRCWRSPTTARCWPRGAAPGWRCGTCATRRRRGGWAPGTATSATPPRVAVLDDGRVLVASASHPAGGLERARRRQLHDAGAGPHRHRRPAPQRRRGRQHRAHRLPELRGRRAWSTSAPARRSAPISATDPSAPPSTLPPVSWTSSLLRRRPHGGQLRPRRAAATPSTPPTGT